MLKLATLIVVFHAGPHLLRNEVDSLTVVSRDDPLTVRHIANPSSSMVINHRITKITCEHEVSHPLTVGIENLRCIDLVGEVAPVFRNRLSRSDCADLDRISQIDL